jgi:hypothetical protein
MSLSVKFGSKRAARIAREIVDDLTATDVEWVIVEAMGRNEDRLCAAISADFLDEEKRIDELDKEIQKLCSAEVWALIDERNCAATHTWTIRQHASLQLGFTAALHLLGRRPRLKPIAGGKRAAGGSR